MPDIRLVKTTLHRVSIKGEALESVQHSKSRFKMMSFIFVAVIALTTAVSGQVQPNIAAIATFRLCSDPNALYTECGPSCGGDGCNQVYYATPGPLTTASASVSSPTASAAVNASLIRPILPCIQQCRAGCFCKCGYYRSPKTGLCVPANQCPNGVTNTQYAQLCPGIGRCCGANEYYTQSNSCLDQCPSYGYYPYPIPQTAAGSSVPATTAAVSPPVSSTGQQLINFPIKQICPLYLASGCFCIPGYKRNFNNICVPISQCPFYPYPYPIDPIPFPVSATAAKK